MKTIIKKYNSKVPLGRLGNPEDIAPAVLFMLSDDAQYITRQNLVVDGGWDDYLIKKKFYNTVVIGTGIFKN